MLEPRDIAEVSAIFAGAFGRPVDEDSYELWLELFGNRTRDRMREAALYLAKSRDKGSTVTPAEMTRALDITRPRAPMMDGQTITEMDREYEKSLNEPGITLHKWLEQEGLATFAEAMQRYGEA